MERKAKISQLTEIRVTAENLSTDGEDALDALLAELSDGISGDGAALRILNLDESDRMALATCGVVVSTNTLRKGRGEFTDTGLAAGYARLIAALRVEQALGPFGLALNQTSGAWPVALKYLFLSTPESSSAALPWEWLGMALEADIAEGVEIWTHLSDRGDLPRLPHFSRPGHPIPQLHNWGALAGEVRRKNLPVDGEVPALAKGQGTHCPDTLMALTAGDASPDSVASVSEYLLKGGGACMIGRPPSTVAGAIQWMTERTPERIGEMIRCAAEQVRTAVDTSRTDRALSICSEVTQKLTALRNGEHLSLWARQLEVLSDQYSELRPSLNVTLSHLAPRHTSQMDKTRRLGNTSKLKTNPPERKHPRNDDY